jgi:hypothetical protein
MKWKSEAEALESWQDAVKTLGISAPTTWIHPGEIAQALNAFPHDGVDVLLPSGGDALFSGAAVAWEEGFVDVGLTGAVALVWPIRLIYDSVNDDPRWSYLRLECARYTYHADMVFRHASMELPRPAPPSTGGEFPMELFEEVTRKSRHLQNPSGLTFLYHGLFLFLPRGSGCLRELLPRETGHIRMSAEELKSFVEQLAAEKTGRAGQQPIEIEYPTNT